VRGFFYAPPERPDAMNKHTYRKGFAAACIALAHLTSAAQQLQATAPSTGAPRGAYISPLLPGHHRVTLNGIATHYEVVGEGPLLVIQAPSWGIGSAYLLNGLAELSKGFTLLAYDVPGSGASDKPAGEYKLTSTEIADHLEALRQYLKREQIDLLGHSQGSALAITYASRYPERVRRLVLVGSQLYGYPGNEKTNSKTCPVVANDQLPDSLPLIKACTLVIDGLQDPVCPPVVSARIKQGIPGAKLLIYENTGHFPWIEQPGRFFPDVSGFLLDSSF